MSFTFFKILPVARSLSSRAGRWAACRHGFQRNYWRRRDSELSTAVQSFENYMREIDKEMNRIFGDIQRFSPVKFPRFVSPFDSGKIREIPVVSTDGGNRSYKLQVEMHGMKPENINITLKNNELSVTARRDEKRDDGSRFVRENAYHYTLPEDINLDTIRSSLSDGILTIEAQLPAIESKEIPVKVESDPKTSSSDSSNQK